MIKFEKFSKLNYDFNININIITHIEIYNDLILCSDFAGKIFIIDQIKNNINKILNIKKNIFSILVLEDFLFIGLKDEIQIFDLKNSYEYKKTIKIKFEGILKMFYLSYKDEFILFCFLEKKLLIMENPEFKLKKSINFENKLIYDFEVYKENIYVLCEKLLIILDNDYEIIKKINLEDDFKIMKLKEDIIILGSNKLIFFDYSNEKILFNFIYEKQNIIKEKKENQLENNLLNKYENEKQNQLFKNSKKLSDEIENDLINFSKESPKNKINNKKSNLNNKNVKINSEEKNNNYLKKKNNEKIKFEVKILEILKNILIIGTNDKIILFEINNKTILFKLNNDISPKKVIKLVDNNIYIGGKNALDIYQVKFNDIKKEKNDLEISKFIDIILNKVNDLIFNIDLKIKTFKFNYDINVKFIIIKELFKIIKSEYIVENEIDHDFYLEKILDINYSLIVNQKNNYKVIKYWKNIKEMLLKFKKKIEIYNLNINN